MFALSVLLQIKLGSKLNEDQHLMCIRWNANEDRTATNCRLSNGCLCEANEKCLAKKSKISIKG